MPAGPQMTRIVTLTAAAGAKDAAATGQGKIVYVHCAIPAAAGTLLTFHSGPTVAGGTLIGQCLLIGSLGVVQFPFNAYFSNGLSVNVTGAASSSILLTIE